ncbi:S1 RNA-binding domain-containing protein, partial [Patescibacteria group bacterium]|nr:S1 RNA-binding domain-containing protein [Patescibacteria group bacterium]
MNTHVSLSVATPVKEALSPLAVLLNDETYTHYPRVGDVVKGNVIAVGRNEVRCDLNGFDVGLIRGPELDKNLDLRIGDEVEATVIEPDNEFGEFEL